MMEVYREAMSLRLIGWRSRLKIVPKVYSNTRYCILMERIQGKTLYEVAKESTPIELKRKIISLIEAAIELDSIGIIHGELTRVGDHIIFENGERPIFIDFGSSKIISTSSNIAQVCSQLFFSNNAVSVLIREKLNMTGVKKDRVLNILRKYKVAKKEGLHVNIEESLIKALD
jgi:putative serine/threonine protein kinase